MDTEKTVQVNIPDTRIRCTAEADEMKSFSS